LRNLIKEAEAIHNSPIKSDRRYGVLFTHFGDSIRPALDECGMKFDYYDPDTSYEEDMDALMSALHDVLEDTEQLIESLRIE